LLWQEREQLCYRFRIHKGGLRLQKGQVSLRLTQKMIIFAKSLATSKKLHYFLNMSSINTLIAKKLFAKSIASTRQRKLSFRLDRRPVPWEISEIINTITVEKRGQYLRKVSWSCIEEYHKYLTLLGKRWFFFFLYCTVLTVHFAPLLSHSC
jgi:hypothetical protein